MLKRLLQQCSPPSAPLPHTQSERYSRQYVLRKRWESFQVLFYLFPPEAERQRHVVRRETETVRSTLAAAR